jgi:pyruvate dehydrogenase E1 component beta subunit
MPTLTYREALNQALAEEMSRDERVMLMGEEVAEYNGAYKVSQGLLEKFGPKRVIDTPISETGFSGLAVGAAMYGLRPVVEFMTWSFSLVAFDQIVNNAAQVRYMSGGQFSVPIVFRGSSGGGLQVGATHSHTPENWYANVPALTVITPAFPDDAKGLLKSAIRSNNPICFIENEKLYGFKDEVPEGEYLTEIGKARVRKEGSDLTIVTNSGSTHRALNAARKVEEESGISVEVIDLRTIKPLDFATIAASVAKTNRCLIVEENKPFAGWGAQVAYQVQRELFDDLDAPVHRLTSLDVPQPYNYGLEQATLPNEDRCYLAIKEILA